LSKADDALQSRRKLAARLKVSTHTLQRILVDGDVPDFSREQTPYVTGSWTRTITRIAEGLGLDAWDLLESAGIQRDGRSEAIVESEGSRIAGGSDREPRRRDRVPDLVEFVMSVAGASADSRSGTAGRDALERLQASLEQYLVATGVQAPGIATGNDLSGGAFCRSCMASLSDIHNRGASDRFCRFCSDTGGDLRPEDEVHEILTGWFLHWQEGITREEASRRARHYMLAMPAWARDRSGEAAGS